ncbi:MAG: hypothetical protein RL181_2174 [Bacteroidota bacterium]
MQERWDTFYTIPDNGICANITKKNGKYGEGCLSPSQQVYSFFTSSMRPSKAPFLL